MIQHDWLQDLIRKCKLGNIHGLSEVSGGKMNHVFRIQLDDGRYIFVKHAGNVPKSDDLAGTLRQIPPARLATEQKALKLLKACHLEGIEIPNVLHFDDETFTLLLTEVCSGGRLLEDELQQGKFDLNVAMMASQFLVESYNATKGIPSLWGGKEVDIDHWEKMLLLRTVDIPTDTLNRTVNRHLHELQQKANAGRENRLVHLDFCPKNILIGDSTIGVIDHELSSSYGDPAYDLGFFLGHYFIWGFATGNTRDCRKAVGGILTIYQEGNSRLWERICSRVVAFTGATILYRILGGSQINVGESEEPLLHTAIELLAQDTVRPENATTILTDAAFDYFRC